MELVKLQKVELPTIEIDDPENGAWTVSLPESLLPADVSEIVMSDRGLYIELSDGRYDFIPWDEVGELADVEGADRVDEPIPYRITPASFAALEAGRVRVEQGPAPTVLTGREQAFSVWLAGQMGIPVYSPQPERLLVPNGRVRGGV